MVKDVRGIEVSASDAGAVEALDRAIDGYLGARNDTGDYLREAMELDPDFVMAHVVRGYFLHLFAHRGLMARSRESLTAARDAAGRVGATPREQAHMAALEAWCDGDPATTLRIHSEILIDHPLDIVALKLSEYWNFYSGDNGGMRDSIGRVLHAWDAGVPAYGFVLGMRAFALEESGAYDEAERIGREAVERNPADIWATHAVAHVMEMNGRTGEGAAWIDGLAPNWGEINNFTYHVWWHRALFALERGAFDEALELYDREVRPESTRDFRDITNAAALLWRFDLEGIDVGDRWVELAEHSAERVGEHVLVFADVHYMLALASVEDRAKAHELLNTADAYAKRQDESQTRVMDAAGRQICAAVLAHREGAYDRAVDVLFPVRGEIRRIGGSHAQRDVFDQTLIHSAIRADRLPLARALLSERLQRRPGSLLTWRRMAGVLDRLGDGAGASRARAKAGDLA
jgi:tetratricopeptide (TPR) repeat protein